MARYRKIEPRFWDDLKVRKLDVTGKAIALYLITASNRIGLFVLSTAKAADDLGLRTETFRERLANVCETLGWGFDEVSRVFWIPSWWKCNYPENPNVMIGNLADLDDVPDSELTERFLSNTKHLRGGVLDAFLERCRNVAETLPERLANQKQKQKQEQEQEEEPPLPLAVEGTPPADAGLAPGSDPIAPAIRAKRGERQAEIAAVFDHWRTVCQHPGAKLDAKRSTLIARRLRDGYSVADLCEAVDGCTRSRFHQGANDQGKVYDGLELILRNGDKVDAFRKVARGEGQTSGDRDWKTEVMNERVRDAFSTAASTQQMIPQVNGAVVGLLKEEENDGPF